MSDFPRDPAGPPWAFGFDVAWLKRCTAVTTAFEKIHCHGAFARISERTIAAAAESDRLHVGGHGDDICTVVVAGPSKASATIKDYAGPALTRPPGAMQITRPACLDGHEDCLREILDRVVVDGRTWLEGFVEADVTRRMADEYGLTRACTKVLAASELLAVWTDDHPAALDLPIRRWPETATIARLEIAVPDDRRTALLRALDRLEPQYADHYSGYNVKNTWSAIALRGYGGDPDFIIKPSEMSKGWKRDNAHTLDWRCEDTWVRDVLPEAEHLIALVPGEHQRIRIMRLRGGEDRGELSRHADITDPESGVADRRVARIHLPLQTNPAVTFWMWDEDGVAKTFHMGEGEAWYLDTRKPHRAVNDGSDDRLHLVIDTYATEDLRRIMPDPLHVPA